MRDVSLYLGDPLAPVVMYPGTTIQLERDVDFFNLLSLNFAYSYDFDLPREGNELIFNHAGDPDNEVNGFTGSLAAQLRVGNNPLMYGTFTLYESDDATSYRGTFESLSLPITSQLDTALCDILDEYDATLYAQTNVNTATVNADADPWVKFPLIDTFFSTEYNSVSASSPNIHFFQAIELVRRTLKAIGYDLIDLATASGDTGQRIYFPGRRITANTKELSDICPDMTVRQLLKSVACFLAADFTVLENSKEIILQSYDRLMADGREIDLTDQIYKTTSHRSEIEGIKFSFATSDQTSDLHVSENPTELQGTLLATVDDIDDLPSGDTGDYCFVILENAWYKYAFNESTNQEQWDFYADDLFPRTVSGAGTEAVAEVSCPAIPMHRDRYGQIPTLQHDFTITDNSGSVRITITSTNFMPSSFASDDLLRIPGVYDEWVTVTGYDGPGKTIDIDVDYIEDASYTAKVFHVRNERTSYMPQVDNSLSEKFPADYDAKVNASLKNRAVIWHGSQLVINTGSSTEVYMATSDNIDNRGNSIADYALRFNGPDNLIDDGPWAAAVAFIAAQDRLLYHYATVTQEKFNELMNSPVRKVRSQDALTLIKKIRYTAGGGDRIQVEIQGYRL